MNSNCSSEYDFNTTVDLLNRYNTGAHLYVALIFAPLGILGNVINVIVFTHKSMKGPTNFLITCLSIADALLLFLNMFFPCLFFINPTFQDQGSENKFIAQLVFFMLIIQNITYAVTTYLTVALGAFRLVYIRLGHRAATVCNMKKAIILLLLVMGVSLPLNVPYIIGHTLETSEPNDNNTVYTRIEFDPKNRGIVLWVTALFFKSIPIVILAVISTMLIHAIQQSQRLHKKLLQNKPNKVNITGNKNYTEISTDGKKSVKTPLTSGGVVQNKEKDRRNSNQITIMLIFVILVQIITLLPQGIILLILWYDHCYEKLYNVCGDLKDLMTLFNNAIGFILYYTTSVLYRRTFAEIFTQKG